LATNLPNRDEEIRSVFAQVAPQIDIVLISRYTLPRQEAQRIEQELFAWFHRLCRRSGAPISAHLLRPQLISMACKVGHIYWSGRGQAGEGLDDAVRRSLALGPELVAIEIEKGIGEREGEKRP